MRRHVRVRHIGDGLSRALSPSMTAPTLKAWSAPSSIFTITSKSPTVPFRDLAYEPKKLWTLG